MTLVISDDADANAKGTPLRSLLFFKARAQSMDFS